MLIQGNTYFIFYKKCNKAKPYSPSTEQMIHFMYRGEVFHYLQTREWTNKTIVVTERNINCVNTNKYVYPTKINWLYDVTDNVWSSAFNRSILIMQL